MSANIRRAIAGTAIAVVFGGYAESACKTRNAEKQFMVECQVMYPPPTCFEIASVRHDKCEASATPHYRGYPGPVSSVNQDRYLACMMEATHEWVSSRRSRPERERTR